MVLTFLYVALAVAGFLLAKPIRNGLFLADYGAYSLVYAYVAVPLALAVGAADLRPASPRGWDHGRSSPARSSSSASTSCCSGGRSGSWATALAGVFYVWVNCFGVIVPVQAWTFASSVFDTRQARRLFGLIGSRRERRGHRRRPARPGAGAADRHGQPAAGPGRPDLPRRGRRQSRLVRAENVVAARETPCAAPAAGRVRRRPPVALPHRAWPLMVFLVAIVTQWTGFQFSLSPASATPATPTA